MNVSKKLECLSLASISFFLKFTSKVGAQQSEEPFMCSRLGQAPSLFGKHWTRLDKPSISYNFQWQNLLMLVKSQSVCPLQPFPQTLFHKHWRRFKPSINKHSNVLQKYVNYVCEQALKHQPSAQYYAYLKAKIYKCK